MIRCIGAFMQLVLLGTLAVPADAAPQEPSSPEPVVRSAPVTTITGPIPFAGTLSEPEWKPSPPMGDLVQRQPNQGEAPTERTEVTLLRDADNLYIGVYAHDSAPGSVIGRRWRATPG